MRYNTPVGLSRVVKNLLGGGKFGHADVAKGTEEDNIKYCSKSDTHVLGPFSEGEASCGQGKRNDLAVMREAVHAGKTMVQLIEIATSGQSLRSAELMLKYIGKRWDRSQERDVRWYHGSTGSGKTRAAFDEFPDAWISMNTGDWFEGYDGQECAILDDVRGDFCKFHVWLRLLDRYPYRVAVKGSSREWVSRVVIVTCPYKPEVLFRNRDGEELQQILRRIKTVRLFGQEVPAPQASVGPVAPHFRILP